MAKTEPPKPESRRTAAPRQRRCPVCKSPLPAGEDRHAPFCSARCRMVDLGRWLGGDYAVPGPPVAPEDLPPRDDES